MVIYFGADHRGFPLKEALKVALKSQGYEIVDLGAPSQVEGDDYPDYAVPVAQKISLDPVNSRGILICGSGAGMDIVANKFPRVRSVLAASPDQAYDARHDDDANILTLAANFINEFDAQKIARVFLDTPFTGEERYTRRIEKILQIENGNISSH
jgi:ribose 5-phosphate isomerase B